MNLYQHGDFTLNSGAKSTFKIECDALTDEDWVGIAHMIHLILLAKDEPFCTVEGVPRGGLKLAKQMEKYRSSIDSSYGVHLICDDVLTTGESMERARTAYQKREISSVIGVVYKARGPYPSWITPLETLHPALWIKEG